MPIEHREPVGSVLTRPVTLGFNGKVDFVGRTMLYLMVSDLGHVRWSHASALQH